MNFGRASEAPACHDLTCMLQSFLHYLEERNPHGLSADSNDACRRSKELLTEWKDHSYAAWVSSACAAERLRVCSGLRQASGCVCRKMVSERYTRANGYEADCEVIYGDTDSVMVHFRVADTARAMELGKQAAEYVSATFVRPIKLEFEKVTARPLPPAKRTSHICNQRCAAQECVQDKEEVC